MNIIDILNGIFKSQKKYSLSLFEIMIIIIGSIGITCTVSNYFDKYKDAHIALLESQIDQLQEKSGKYINNSDSPYLDTNLDTNNEDALNHTPTYKSLNKEKLRESKQEGGESDRKINKKLQLPYFKNHKKEPKTGVIEGMIWGIGNRDNSNIEFDDKDCNDVKNKKSNEWKKVVNFRIGENIKCFPGMLWSKEEETAPNQICIFFECQAKIDKPICLTIYFIGKKTRELSLSSSSVACFSAVIDNYPLLKTNITSDFDQQKQYYKWTKKRLFYDKELESGFHQIKLAQQKGCIKFDCLKLEIIASTRQ